jgi:lipopolysaccharide export system protein LptA
MANFVWIRNLALLSAAGGLGFYAYQGLKNVASIDPFSALRPKGAKDIPDEVLVQLKDVKLRHFQAGKLVTEATADSVDVNKDRVSFAMKGIRDGKSQTNRGPIRFSAKSANWNSAIKRLAMNDTARVAGKDFDVSSPSLTLDDQKKLLTVPQASGRLGPGIAKMTNFEFHLPTGAWRAGPSRYIGALPGVQDANQVIPANGRTKWDISMESLGDTGNEDKTQTFNNATATDGEVLIKAPKVSLDKKTDVLTATGRVFYYSAKANLVADKVVVYRREKRAVLTGNVFLLAKPKEEVPNYKPSEEELPPFKPMVPDDVKAGRPAAPESGPSPEEKALDDKLREGGSLREFPLIITSDEVEYFYKKGERRANVRGNPQARQEITGGRWRHVWSYLAVYDGEKETLVATSKPGERTVRMKNSLGDDLTGLTITLSTKEGDSKYYGEKLKGTVTTDATDDPREKKPDGEKPAGVPPPKVGGGT